MSWSRRKGTSAVTTSTDSQAPLGAGRRDTAGPREVLIHVCPSSWRTTGEWTLCLDSTLCLGTQLLCLRPGGGLLTCVPAGPHTLLFQVCEQGVGAFPVAGVSEAP